jgi:O-antigen ligase
MHQYSLNFVYIAIGIVLLVILLVNRYWGTFVIILAQPFFISVASTGAGTGATKIVYGVLFAVWFGGWALSKPFASNTSKPLLANSMVPPTLAFGAVLAMAILLGLIYGASLDDTVRDLSQYVGYLAVLPLLDLVRTPKQAKRLIYFLVLLGLPSSIIADMGAASAKQEIDMSHTLLVFKYASPYWGPFQGAIWTVAVSFPGFLIKLLAWIWLTLKSSLSVFSGVRGMLIGLIVSASTAFLVSGRIARHSLARYVIPLFLTVVVGGVLADLSGMVNLPFSAITRDRYSTMLSEKGLLRDRSMQGRFLESRALLQNFLKNPVTGIGLGHTLKGKGIPGGYTFRFHNGYLETLMKFGLLGSAIFAWYFLTLFRQAFELVRISDSYFAKVIGLGVVIWLVTYVIGSVAGSAFSDRAFALTVGVMAGVLPALTLEGIDKQTL